MFYFSLLTFFFSGVPLVPRVGLSALVLPKYGSTPLQSLTHTAALPPFTHLIYIPNTKIPTPFHPISVITNTSTIYNTSIISGILNSHFYFFSKSTPLKRHYKTIKKTSKTLTTHFSSKNFPN